MSRQPPDARYDPNALARQVGRRVAEIRESRCQTQENLAEALGCSVVRVQTVERGANLTIASLCELAEALSCEVADLFMAPTSLQSRPGRPQRRS